MSRLKISILILGILTATVGRAQVINLNGNNEQTIKYFRSSNDSIPQDFLKEAKNARFFVLNPVLQSAKSIHVGNIVELQLFENQSYRAEISNIATDINGTVALTLKLPDYPMSFAIITTSSDGKSLVNISIPELSHTFGSLYNMFANQYYLIEMDESKQPHFDCGNEEADIPEPIEIPLDDADNTGMPPSAAPSLQDELSCSPDPNLGVDDPAQVDLLIVYTAAAKAYADARGGIANVIANYIVSQANECLSRSQTGVTFNVVHSAQIDYTETNNSSTDLNGYLAALQTDANIQALRKQYNADLVQLLVIDSNEAGLGNVLRGTNATNGNAGSAFSVVTVSATISTFSSTHELGHNMGLGHGANQESSTAEGIFPYSLGWDWLGNNSMRYCSIMAYSSATYYSDKISRTRVGHFSNPNVIHSSGVATGDATKADAARSLRETKHLVASYGDRVASLPAAPANVRASNPTSRGATITWDAVPGATSYQLYFSYNGGWLYYSPTTNRYTLNHSTYFQTCNSYQVYVRAVNSCGVGIQSSTISFSTTCPTEPPTGLNEPGSNILIYSRSNAIQAVSGSLLRQVSVFNMQGQKIYDKAINACEQTITDLAPGIYMVKAVSLQEVKTTKVIVK